MKRREKVLLATPNRHELPSASIECQLELHVLDVLVKMMMRSPWSTTCRSVGTPSDKQMLKGSRRQVVSRKVSLWVSHSLPLRKLSPLASVTLAMKQ